MDLSRMYTICLAVLRIFRPWHQLGVLVDVWVLLYVARQNCLLYMPGTAAAVENICRVGFRMTLGMIAFIIVL